MMLNRVIFAITVATSLAAQVGPPDRRVQKNVIVSTHDPQVTITLPENVQYAGANRWVLYDIADCELHAFVEADAHKNVQRLYRVQFEDYLPSKPDLHHTYDSPRHTTIGGLDFYVDTWVRAKDENTKPGSDREHIEALVKSHGYTMPAGMMYVRLIHLLDAAKRKELMIIYGEALAPTGLTASQLNEGGSAHGKWADIADGLVHRAEQRIQIQVPK